MDKQSDSENTAPAAAKSAKNGNGKDKGKAPQQQQSSPSQPAPAPSKPVVKRKRKRVKDANAPKHPLTGYVRYMNEKRDAFRVKNPSLPAVEITKLIAEEWGTLSEEVKKPFLEAAEADRERYHREVVKYKQNNETALSGNKKPKTNGDDLDLGKEVPYLNGKEERPREIRIGDYEIPIFTDDFLEHNKVIDSELRLLRKSNIDYEQQNSVLEKHVENMDNGIQKLENETSSLKTRNAVLQSYLLKLKSVLAGALAGLPIGSDKEGATVDNIDKYMAELHQMAKSSTQGHALNKAKDIIRKLDLQNLAT